MPSSPARRPARTCRAGLPSVVVTAALVLAGCSVGGPPDDTAPTAAAVELSTAPAEPTVDASPSDDEQAQEPDASDHDEPEGSPTPEPKNPAYPLFDERTDRALQTIAAMEATLGAGVFKIDGNGDGTEWKLELARGNQRLKVKVETDDTGLNHRGIDTDDLDDEDRDALDSTQISLSEAIARVVDSTNGVLDKAELEEDDGAAFWEITVHMGDDDEDYRVDLATGAITRDD
ncbi:PepSY domain-containing protein [Isoptericola croceus]|uniref:PepSY domain-containing protein n=1 Tax=Isoptericola croceus TaxID=3031406 RepID=UPI0023F7E0B9|nr:PepSY domain-containing protein [Isoptericola croceus]